MFKTSQAASCFGIAALIGMFALSCGGAAKRAQAPKKDLGASELRVFPPQRVQLDLKGGNTFFFWKRGFDKDQVATVLQLSKSADQIADACFPLASERDQVETQKLQLRDKKETVSSALKEINVSLKELKQKLKDLPPESEAERASLKQKVEELEGQKAQKEKERADIQAKIQELSKLKNDLDSSITSYMHPGTGMTSEMTLQKIKEQVDADLFRSPSSVVFEFLRGGSIRAEMWIENDQTGVSQAFSTEEGTLRDVVYVPLGGVFTFETVSFTDETKTEVKETDAFRIVRVRYEVKDRVFFAGDVIRKTNPAHCERRGLPADECQDRYGVIKLSGRSAE